MNILPENLPNMGLGIMRFENLTSKESILGYQKIVDRMMEAGYNYFEGCQFYLDYKCERLLQHLLRKYDRSSYFLADKMAVKGILDNVFEGGFENIFNEQLRRMNTSYFDFYLAQALDRHADQIANYYLLYEGLDWIRKTGKAKYIGFSFHDTPEWLDHFLNKFDWDFVQIQLNYFNYYNNYGKDLYEIATAHNVPIFVMGSTQGGMLSNTPNEVHNIIKNDLKMDDTELAIRFLRSLPNVRLVLNGVTNLDQLNENLISNVKDPLDDTERNIIKDKIIPEFNKFNSIGCTGCKYCESHCKSKVSISKIFKAYNRVITEKTEESKKDYMNLYNSSTGPFRCVKCGECEKYCPQHLPIREKLDFLAFKFRC